jgi:transcriptional regulator with XRE-family HTH domain
VELARPLDAAPDRRSPLGAVRLQRKLTVEEAAKRAALWPEQVEWLEEGKLYRFPTTEAAMMALLRYATSLGIDHREARKMSGMPVEPPRRRPVGRWIATGGALALVAALTLVLVLGLGGRGSSPATKADSRLVPPWRVAVDVLNGGGDINYTRTVASRIGSFGYRIEHVTKANRFDYRETQVYFEPGGGALARRLAAQMGCGTTSPLPGGRNPHRLVVIVGRPRATC